MPPTVGSSTAKASRSKTKTPTAKANVKSPEGLGFILNGLVWAGEQLLLQAQDEDEDSDDSDDDNDGGGFPFPPALRAFTDKGFPPLWQPLCPDDVPQWKAHWNHLRNKFPCGVEYSNETLKAKFVDGAAEEMFAAQAIEHDWLTILDNLITSELESTGATFKAHYADPGFATSRKTGKYPGVELWSSVKCEVLRVLFGVDIVSNVVPQPLTIWWGYVLSKYVEREKATAVRHRNKYDILIKKLTTLLGEDFLMGSDDAAKKFSARQCAQVIKVLRQCWETLVWDILDKEELKQLSTPLDPVTPASIAQFDELLTPGAKRHEHVARVLGWMTRMLVKFGSQSRLPQEIEGDLEDYQLQGYARGQGLADSWDQRHTAMVRGLEAADVDLFHDEIQTFVRDWQNREHDTVDEGVMRLLTGADPEQGLSDWLSAGEDLGVESVAKFSVEQLQELLGIKDGRFPTFRQHVAKDWTKYAPGNTDEEIPGETTVFALRHHQLVAIVAILQKAVNPAQGSLSRWPEQQSTLSPNAPQALREYWGSLPGHWLADTVGLGKTWTSAGLIGAYMHLHAFSKGAAEGGPLPFILGKERSFKFGPCEEIPDAAHIVVVPGSLLGHWRDQLKRLFRSPAVVIKTIRPASKYWANDLEMSANVPLVNHIFVIGVTTVSRMAKQAGVTGSPPTFRPPDGASIFSRSFGVCIADEAHDFRKGSSAHQAMWALSDLSLITVLASATPLIEGLADVHQQARIIRPPGLTAAVDGSLMTQLALVKKIRRQHPLDRAVDLQTFMDAKSTHAATTADVGIQGGAGDDVRSAMEQAQQRGVRRLKEICLRHTIRRTGNSKNPNGTTLTGALPRSTFLHVVFTPSEAEIQASRALEESNVSEGKLESARRVDAFYNEARKYLSYPPRQTSTSRSVTVNDRKPGEPLSKLSILTELLVKGLRDGPQTIVPEQLLGTNTRIVRAGDDLQLADVAAKDYVSAKLLPGEGMTEKVVVFTQYAQYHAAMKVYLESAGISVETVSGVSTAKKRHEAILAFADGPKRCLIISNVGGVGVDLTFARMLVIYEQLWSGVMTHQLLGRINREGQSRETFSFSLAGHNTIDMLLMLMALRKASVAQDYITPERRKEFYKSYGTLVAGDEDSDAVGELDQEITENLAQAAKAGRKKIKTARKEPSNKRKAPESGDQTSGNANPQRRRRVKSAAEVPDSDDPDAMDVDKDQTPATRTRSKNRVTGNAQASGSAPKA